MAAGETAPLGSIATEYGVDNQAYQASTFQSESFLLKQLYKVVTSSDGGKLRLLQPRGEALCNRHWLPGQTIFMT